MSLSNRVILLLFLLIPAYAWTGGLLSAEEKSLSGVERKARLLTHEIYPGDEIVVEMEFSSTTPFTAETAGNLALDQFELKSRTTDRKEESGRIFITHRFVLLLFKPGDYEVPQITFSLRQNSEQEEWKSDKMRVIVKSLLEEEAMKMAMQQRQDRTANAKPSPNGPAQIVDPNAQPFGPAVQVPGGSLPPPSAPSPGAPPPPEPEKVQLAPREIQDPLPLSREDLTLLYLLVGLAGALLLFGLVYLIYRRHRRRQTVEDEPVARDLRPAHVIALGRLDDLESHQLIAKRLIKEFHLELSAILREYFSRRYNLDSALSYTSEEVSQQLKRLYLKELNESMVSQILFAGDLVKFAKDLPTDEECYERLNLARTIVQRTKESE